MKPGITGIWQISGRSDITDFEEIVKLDMEYIKNWNIGLDLRIMWKTLGVVMKGKGLVLNDETAETSGIALIFLRSCTKMARVHNDKVE